MDIEQLRNLHSAPSAPVCEFDRAVWLHNKIVELVRFELWQFRENRSNDFRSSYAACNHIMQLPSLTTI